MQEVIPHLWIGDYVSSQDEALLARHDISALVCSMKQDYTTMRRILRIPVDDTSATNIIAHFPSAYDFIHDALSRDENVLVHCQAGVSRSTTLVAAYLMKEEDMTCDEAVETVRLVRGQVDPNEFFMHQLEMYERCENEWNPVKWSEQRRFLMNFAQAQIMDGADPAIVLAYYPSPAPSPGPASRADSLDMLKMTPVDAASVAIALEQRRRRASSSSDTKPEKPSPPARKRLTARAAPAPLTASSSASSAPAQKKAVVEKIGAKGEVVVVGKRIRCKLCRRELAAREHIVVHEIGIGQQAFAPHRRDMAAHRAEQERRRLDQLDKERLESRNQLPAVAPSPLRSSASDGTPAVAPVASGLAALRISTPRVAGIPGLRIAQPRPRVPERDVTASTMTTDSSSHSSPVSSSPSSGSPAIGEDHSSSSPSPPPSELTPAVPAELSSDENGAPSPELPLLPSHLCSSYFVEPLSWMSPTLETGILAGKLSCPNSKCGAKLGSYDWAGLQCSCGAWVLPGFALNVSRVDEFKPAK